MATFEAPVVPYRAVPHTNADSLEIAEVAGWRVACRIGDFKAGQKVAYIPEASVLPDDLIKDLGLVGKLSGAEHNRVKAIRLRGELSQGLLYSGYRIKHLAVGDDAIEALGIVKWEPPIPVHMAGQVEAGPAYNYDIDNIKSWPRILKSGEDVAITEKLHGTFCCLGYQRASDGFQAQPVVTSKGNLKMGRKLKADVPENEHNLYVRAWRDYSDAIVAQVLASEHGSLMFFGEICGPKVQDLSYGFSRPAFMLFDVRCDDMFLPWDNVQKIAAECGMHTVPELWRGPWSEDLIAEHTKGQSTIAAHVREGVVIRPLSGRYDYGDPELRRRGPGRVMFKAINEKYLLRKGGTEFN